MRRCAVEEITKVKINCHLITHFYHPINHDSIHAYE